jgi:hypothetical protein
MAEHDQPAAGAASDVPLRLREVAQLLRRAHHLGPEAREALADLADELAGAVGSGAVSSAEGQHLAATAGHLIEVLHHNRDEGAVAAARRRVEEAVLAAEARAPVAAGLAHRLLDALADLGI